MVFRPIFVESRFLNLVPSTILKLSHRLIGGKHATRNFGNG